MGRYLLPSPFPYVTRAIFAYREYIGGTGRVLREKGSTLLAVLATRRSEKCVRTAFTDEFLKKPTTADCQFLLQLHEQAHGFPGMLGSVDCMHWQWKNCPVAWRGSYTSGNKGTHPTVILEAVTDYRLWIWHVYFGVPGLKNDVNVLNNSNLFSEVLNGKAPAINFIANNRQYKMGYYLADGIYPKWPTFVKRSTGTCKRKTVSFCAETRGCSQGCAESVWGSPSSIYHYQSPGSYMVYG
ncbi:uncharacterized protein LOC125221321 [Salvia hispanica]|uniref:uncharacterized protein LOC125221321 n=1 Tax=Salvia hispanica TaxID=49212 RepID=UPI002009CBA8|nr:uncharacterized protein LOC125221321 [Salvia hispanica]